MIDEAGIAGLMARIQSLRPARIILLLLCSATPSMAAAPANARLPDTAAGHLAGELIRHINELDPEKSRQWVSAALSTAVPSDDRASFINDVVSASRDSGGLDVFDVRVDPRQPEVLEIAVKARRNARAALFWLGVDPAHASEFTQAALAPMDDPLYSTWPEKAVSKTELGKQIRAVMDAMVRTSDFSGCVSVFDGREVLFDECRGLAERSFNVPVTHETKFHIGSMNKMFTAVAIAQLVEAGKMSWDDSLAKRVPEYPDQNTARKITVWDLLHHTSGLGDFLVPEYFEHPDRFVNPVDYLGLISRQPLTEGSGQQFNYSNAGFMLLGRVIENVSGESYFDYIQHHVFEPAGMTSSGFDSVNDVVSQLAVGYYHDDGMFSRLWKAAWLKMGYRSGPAGGGYSTNADLLRFASALHEGRLVKPVTLAKMFEGEVPAGPGGYAAGFGDRLSHGLHVRGHQGGIEGTTANLEMVWETGEAVALTSNQGPSAHWLLVEKIADALTAGHMKK